MSDPYQPAPQQPPYGAQPGAHPVNAYTQPGSPYPQPPYGSGAAVDQAATGTLGRTAFIVAVVTGALGLVFTLITPFLIVGARFGSGGFALINTLQGLLGLALGAVALILGVIAARRRAQPVLAGIAIGVGALEVLSVLSGLMATAMYPLLY